MPHINSKWLRLPGRLWRDREGASMLEFAVVLPFLIVFAFGVFEFGNALFQYNQVTAGVRDAGRFLGSIDKDAPDATINAKKIAICGEVESCTVTETRDDRRVPWWPADIADDADIEGAIQVQYCMGDDPEPADLGICDCHDLKLHNFENFGSNKVCVSTTADYGDLGFLGSLGLGPLEFTINHEQRYYGIR